MATHIMHINGVAKLNGLEKLLTNEEEYYLVRPEVLIHKRYLPPHVRAEIVKHCIKTFKCLTLARREQTLFF